MVKIIEDYVSFEVAKLLKDKGFPLPSTNFEDWVFCMYDKNGDIQWGCYHPDYYARVTLQMALKWLREVHNTIIIIIPSVLLRDNLKWIASIRTFNKEEYYLEEQGIVGKYNTYEEATENAIKCCLENLI